MATTDERKRQQREYKRRKDAREKAMRTKLAALRQWDSVRVRSAADAELDTAVALGLKPLPALVACLERAYAALISDAFDGAHDERILRETLADKPSADDEWRCSGKYGCGEPEQPGVHDWERSPTKPYLHRACYNRKHIAYMAARKAVKVGASA